MSATELINHTTSQTRDMPGLFKIYCEDKFGRWTNYLEDCNFCKMATINKEKYGNSVFRELVNFVAHYEKMPIKDVLADFGSFVNTYY